MLFLLRKIRRKLMQNLPAGKAGNKFSSYLLYAVGEIILVVVGILIAVSINDWNEERKHIQVERKYFQNLKNDLIADSIKLALMVDYCEAKAAAAKNVTSKVKQGMSGSLYDFSRDMQTLIFVNEFRPEQSAYNEMKNSGNFSTIQNDLLKLKLVKLQQAYIEIEAMQEHVRYDFSIFLEDFERYIDWSNYYDLGKSDINRLDLAFDSAYIERNSKAMHSEIASLFSNKVFANNIFLVEINHTYQIQLLNNTISQISEILDILNQEIEKKK